jgi:hypothetical protein
MLTIDQSSRFSAMRSDVHYISMVGIDFRIKRADHRHESRTRAKQAACENLGYRCAVGSDPRSCGGVVQ